MSLFSSRLLFLFFVVVFGSLNCHVSHGFSVVPATSETFHLVEAASRAVLDHSLHQVTDLFSVYQEHLAQHPLPTKMMTGATLAVAGDAIAQRSAGDEYDPRRAASFAVFDSAYRALQHVAFPFIVQHCQGQFLSQALHLPPMPAAAMEQTLASQLIIVPFLYYPAFFALTAAVQGLDANAAVTRAKDNFLPLMKRNLLFWIPVQFVQFGFVPDDLQIPFLSCCGLAWTFILSCAAGSAKKYSGPNQQQQLQHATVPDKQSTKVEKRQLASYKV
jgi:hypothetical protein